MRLSIFEFLKHFETCDFFVGFPKIANSSGVQLLLKLRIGGPRACAYPRWAVGRWFFRVDKSKNLAGIVCRDITIFKMTTTLKR